MMPADCGEPVRENVALVWSGHHADFALVTKGEDQFVAFYSATRSMTVGHRRLGHKYWEFKELPTRLGWSSQNRVVLDVDSEGFVHVSGNMYNSPLIYFKSSRPFDIQTLAKSDMIGRDEARISHPRFLTTPAGELIYFYRSGDSGNSAYFFNAYDLAGRRWRRLFDRPLLDGEGRRGVHLRIRQDPAGAFHAVWIWRDGPGPGAGAPANRRRDRALC